MFRSGAIERPICTHESSFRLPVSRPRLPATNFGSRGRCDGVSKHTRTLNVFFQRWPSSLRAAGRTHSEMPRSGCRAPVGSVAPSCSKRGVRPCRLGWSVGGCDRIESSDCAFSAHLRQPRCRRRKFTNRKPSAEPGLLYSPGPLGRRGRRAAKDSGPVKQRRRDARSEKPVGRSPPATLFGEQGRNLLSLSHFPPSP